LKKTRLGAEKRVRKKKTMSMNEDGALNYMKNLFEFSDKYYKKICPVEKLKKIRSNQTQHF